MKALAIVVVASVLVGALALLPERAKGQARRHRVTYRVTGLPGDAAARAEMLTAIQTSIGASDADDLSVADRGDGTATIAATFPGAHGALRTLVLGPLHLSLVSDEPVT